MWTSTYPNASLDCSPIAAAIGVPPNVCIASREGHSIGVDELEECWFKDPPRAASEVGGLEARPSSSAKGDHINREGIGSLAE